jgi:hypothetical protein
VVGAVNGDEAPPPELKLAWACERWHSLPEAGAYLDQDYQLMNRMNIFTNIYNVYSHYRNLQGSQIHTLSDGQRNVLRWLKDNGILFKA